MRPSQACHTSHNGPPSARHSIQPLHRTCSFLRTGAIVSVSDIQQSAVCVSQVGRNRRASPLKTMSHPRHNMKKTIHTAIIQKNSFTAMSVEMPAIMVRLLNDTLPGTRVKDAECDFPYWCLTHGKSRTALAQTSQLNRSPLKIQHDSISVAFLGIQTCVLP